MISLSTSRDHQRDELLLLSLLEGCVCHVGNVHLYKATGHVHVDNVLLSGLGEDRLLATSTLKVELHFICAFCKWASNCA